MASWLFAQVHGFIVEREPTVIKQARRTLFDSLAGEVLEVGAGTGVNFRYYPDGVSLTASDYSPHMMRKLEQPARDASIPITLRQADAQKLPFKTNSFDHALVTLVFCSVPNPPAGFAELERVVRPGGTVRLLEHVQSTSARTSNLQRWITPVWKHIGDGCHLNRDTVATIEASGLAIDDVHEVDGTPPLFPIKVIRASVPA